MAATMRSASVRAPSPTFTTISGISNYRSDSYRGQRNEPPISAQELKATANSHYTELTGFLATHISKGVPFSVQERQGSVAQPFSRATWRARKCPRETDAVDPPTVHGTLRTSLTSSCAEMPIRLMKVCAILLHRPRRTAAQFSLSYCNQQFPSCLVARTFTRSATKLVKSCRVCPRRGSRIWPATYTLNLDAATRNSERIWYVYSAQLYCCDVTMVYGRATAVSGDRT